MASQDQAQVFGGHTAKIVIGGKEIAAFDQTFDPASRTLSTTFTATADDGSTIGPINI